MSKLSFVISIVALLAVIALGVAIFIFGDKTEKVDTGSKSITITQDENATQPAEETAKTDVPMEPSGFKIEVIKQGTGSKVTKDGDGLSVNYTGTLTDGTKFDSSYDRNEPFKFDLGAGQVIKGWDQGLIGMKVGEIRKLTIPPSLGYGSNAMGSKIPANSTLIFEVELMEII